MLHRAAIFIVPSKNGRDAIFVRAKTGLVRHISLRVRLCHTRTVGEKRDFFFFIFSIFLRQIYKKSRKATKKTEKQEKKRKKGRAFLRDICRGRASLAVLYVLFVVFVFFFTKHVAEFVPQPFQS
jgi:hypothetical protein